MTIQTENVAVYDGILDIHFGNISDRALLNELILGQVPAFILPPGFYETIWNALIPSSVYFYKYEVVADNDPPLADNDVYITTNKTILFK